MSGTDIVLDINPGPFWSIPEELTRVGDRLFLTAYNLASGGELWVVDGGSASMIDICPGACSGGARGITAVGDLAYFRSLGDGTTGAELWALAVPLFFDGFETGDTSAWSSEVGGSP